ncbi:MAG: bifunctional DNA primase/polymerase, partial [Thermomicrobia bacterium]|nr:bifunctional DNA primase/polymerase [Thermomicrobia bacterium]
MIAQAFAPEQLVPGPIGTHDAAQAYARRGWFVVPMQEKVPLIRRWPSEATVDGAVIKQRFVTDYPGANVGIVTGKSRLVVFDIDPRNGGDESLHELVRLHGRAFTETVTCLSGGGGQHLYYLAGDRITRDYLLAPGIDVRGKGLVVAPPSLHSSGQAYVWEAGYAPDDLDPLPVPLWLPTGPPFPNPPSRSSSPLPLDFDTSKNIHTGINLPEYPVVILPEMLRGLSGDLRFVTLAAPFLGIPAVPIGKGFLCVLHQERHPSAALFQMDDGRVMYHDWHARGSLLEWLTLPEVLAALRYQGARKLHPPEHAVWTLRLAYEIGALPPAPVAMPPLVGPSTSALHKVYEGVKLLFGLKWRYAHGEPTALSWGFSAAWCGVALN